MAAMRQSITGKERGRKEGRGRPGKVGNATSRAEATRKLMAGKSGDRGKTLKADPPSLRYDATSPPTLGSGATNRSSLGYDPTRTLNG